MDTNKPTMSNNKNDGPAGNTIEIYAFAQDNRKRAPKDAHGAALGYKTGVARKEDEEESVDDDDDNDSGYRKPRAKRTRAV